MKTEIIILKYSIFQDRLVLCLVSENGGKNLNIDIDSLELLWLKGTNCQSHSVMHFFLHSFMHIFVCTYSIYDSVINIFE